MLVFVSGISVEVFILKKKRGYEKGIVKLLWRFYGVCHLNYGLTVDCFDKCLE